jgi:ribonuclease P protein subunit RPR2
MDAREKRIVEEIARERIEILFRLALEVFHYNPRLAQRYVDLARRISMKNKVRIKKQWKLLICKNCKRLLIPGVNCRIRLQQRREPHLVISCLDCEGIKRIPLKVENLKEK